MAGLCEGGNEPPGSLKATGYDLATGRRRARSAEAQHGNEVGRASASWGMCCGVERRDGDRGREGEVMRLRLRGEIQRIREAPSSGHL
ncbi:hypothetical protein ANN_20532 [Periplaneta americana]|uniref:Uncharacterized protein n=1 Tax=Periplaneta americana TaxID=6978 RepID=A0ABQ8SE17_PERAM|nr:hypothetical protein ANN_20532 [Periplaneta americana]